MVSAPRREYVNIVRQEAIENSEGPWDRNDAHIKLNLCWLKLQLILENVEQSQI
jgi:hypothetical protein